MLVQIYFNAVGYISYNEYYNIVTNKNRKFNVHITNMITTSRNVLFGYTNIYLNTK